MQIRPSVIYITISGLSFIILSLQIALSILFQVIAFSPILAISLTFLGLSAGGIFSYVKYSRKDLPLNIYIPAYLNISGLLLLFYTIAIKWHSASILKKEQLLRDISWDKKIIDSFSNSALISIGFVVLFFCLGSILSLIYRQHSNKAEKLYFFDLIGAACGCIFGTIIFNFLQLSSILILFSLSSFLLAILPFRKDITIKFSKITSISFVFITALLLIINIKTDFLEPELNPNFLARDWEMKQECVEIWHRWNTYSRISLIKSKLQRNSHPMYAFSINTAEGIARVVDFKQDFLLNFKPYTWFTPVVSAFLTDTPKDILILFAGAGMDMVDAYYYSKGTSDITGVELNPLIVNKAISLPESHLKGFFAKKNVHMVNREARSYLETTDKLFDTIILTAAGASTAQNLGLPNYTGQYLFTKEAILSYLKHLKPNATLGIFPRNKIQIVAAAKEAFEEIGENDFPSKLIIFDKKESILNGQSKRNFFSLIQQTSFLLIKKSGFSKNEITKIDEKIGQMGMGWIYNPYYTHEGFEFIEHLIKSENTRHFLSKLKTSDNRNFMFPTDNKPFNYNVFLPNSGLTLKSLALNIRSIFFNAAAPAISFSYLILNFNMFLLAAGLLFIILPLAIKTKNTPKTISVKLLFYFSILGLGFVLVEIGIMQIFTLFLGNPTYSFSIALASLLISTGIGAFLSSHLFGKGYLNIKKASLLSFSILLLYFFFLPKINTNLLFLSFFHKLLIAFTSILPLGLCLGMFFPQGLKQAQSQDKNLIPWAWGLNSYMSILGSVLSPYLAWAAGFKCFFLVAAFLYLMLTFINTHSE